MVQNIDSKNMSDSEDNTNSNMVDGETYDEEPLSRREAEIAALGRDFSQYTYDANFAVYFKLIHDRKEIEEDIRKGTFHPDWVHQFFPETERIFGYKKPVIRFFYSASRLKRYVNFDYEDKLSKAKDGIEPDDVMSHLSPVLEGVEYTQDLNQFIREVESREEEEFRPPGDLLHEFEMEYKKPKMTSRAMIEQMQMAGEEMTNGRPKNGESSGGLQAFEQNGSANSQPPTTKRFQILHANANTKGFAQFQSRMQSLIMWFIESALMIDYSLPKWDFFLMFEKYNPTTSEDPDATSISSEDKFFFVGYATVFRYFAYPDKSRPRIAQMMLLPPYRRNGLGTILLQSIYDYYKKQPAILDLTVEDPDEEFITMRDLLDCKNCLELDAFHPENLKKGWTEDIAKEAQQKLKLCQRQARKVYEILKLKSIDDDDLDAFRDYRLEIKNRLNIPFQKLKLDCNRVEKRGIELPEEMKSKRDNHKLVAASLEENYQELLKQYKHTIEKLNKWRKNCTIG